MPLQPIDAILRDAVAGAYAVGYFESWDLASLQGVVDAAERARSPVILGFNGEFLSRPGRLAAERLALYAGLGRAVAESATVPCALIFNECPDDDRTREAIALGFNLVMPVPGGDPPDRYRQRVIALTQLAHESGVGVEAELGELPHGASGDSGEPTDPDEAAGFVAAAGVDVLAVSVGNVHVLLRGERGLDLDRLEMIHRRVPIPLALHGGTGIAPGALREAIARGVAKVNYGTYLKQRYLAALRRALGREEANPHRLLGLGGPEDALVAGRIAVRDAVLERIDYLGCRGRA
jgi:fructose/tagatose bisphosphate aldolase